jgi:hypothetical protein
MACNPTLTGISFDCTDLGIGGLTKVYIANKEDLDGIVTVSGNTVTIAPTTTTLVGDGDAVEIDFNLKDGFSVFSEVKTVTADGTINVVPTISIEIPKMTAAHRDELEEISKAGAELVAFVETAAGTHHLVGWDYGLYASTVDATSGTGRSEKNRYQITFTGEEDALSLDIADAEWDDVA